jgi:glycosyltransferase involved in cell wall biosynthesis
MKLTAIYNRISHHAGPSGYDRLVDYLAQRMAVHRLEHYQADFLSQAMQERLSRRPRMEWYDIWSLALEAAALRRALRTRDQIYHYLYAEDSYYYLAKARSLLRAKNSFVVCSYHQPPQYLDRVVPRKSAISKADAVVVMASNQTAYFQPLVGRQRVFVVPHGIDTRHYQPGEFRDRDPRLCLAVGQWLRDFEMLRDVIRVINARDSSIRFRIITHEEHRSLFCDLANVQFLSNVSDEQLLNSYQTAGMLLLPLIDSTANNSVLEAMACGLPIVSTDVGGIREYVSEDFGCLIARGNTDAMAEAVVRLACDRAGSEEMARRARRRALELDWSQIAVAQLKVYQMITAGISA